MISKNIRFTNEDMMHRTKVRSVYKTENGRAELLRFLLDMGVFREITVEQLPLRNYAIHRLEEMGILDEEAIVELVDFMVDLPIAQRPTVEEMSRTTQVEEDI